jgi:hypothetical protein
MQFRHANLFLFSMAGLGFIPSCTVEPNDDIAEAIDPVQGCTGTGTAVNDMVCGVGLSANGYLAVNFRTKWWALDFNNGYWAVENNVVAAAANVTPTYTVTDDAICNCQCDPTQQGYPQCQQACSNACLNLPHMCTERVTYAVRVGGLDYRLEVRQHVMDLRDRDQQRDRGPHPAQPAVRGQDARPRRRQPVDRAGRAQARRPPLPDRRERTQDHAEQFHGLGWRRGQGRG